jgi:hypothetical protein
MVFQLLQQDPLELNNTLNIPVKYCPPLKVVIINLKSEYRYSCHITRTPRAETNILNFLDEDGFVLTDDLVFNKSKIFKEELLVLELKKFNFNT